MHLKNTLLCRLSIYRVQLCRYTPFKKKGAAWLETELNHSKQRTLVSFFACGVGSIEMSFGFGSGLL